MPESIFSAGPDDFQPRAIVTFREGASREAKNLLSDKAGIRSLAEDSDFEGADVDMDKVADAPGLVLNELGVATAVDVPADAAAMLCEVATQNTAVLAVEQEGIRFTQGCGCGGSCGCGCGAGAAITGQVLNCLLQCIGEGAGQGSRVAARAVSASGPSRRCFADSERATWGLTATRSLWSDFTGNGIRVAILDTGIDLQHPDFVGRTVISSSFVPGQSVDDRLGHGTHVAGTACGSENPASVRRYGIATESNLFVGKVLSNSGSGRDSWILAGMNWAVRSGCAVINLSLGSGQRTVNRFYEEAGRRALQRGSLMVAAAGNNARRPRDVGWVGSPANACSILAIGSVDQCLRVARHSARSANRRCGKIDLVGPGVDVFSCWPVDVSPGRHHTSLGTSMATPHVVGIAALFAQATGARGVRLLQELVSHARNLPLNPADVGVGLVRAP